MCVCVRVFLFRELLFTSFPFLIYVFLCDLFGPVDALTSDEQFYQVICINSTRASRSKSIFLLGEKLVLARISLSFRVTVEIER